MDLKLEVVVLPVSDVDRAKRFYEKVGFRLDADHVTDETYRVVHMTPPGSPCQHSDAEVILSFPGLGVQLGARMLAEIGDDRRRFTDARGLKAYAGAAPVTRASGKKHHVGRRMIKNDRLNHAGYLWAFSALRSSPGAEAHYRRRREQGDWHAAAQRHLFNRMIGQLYHCLQTSQLFDEHVAFTSQLATAA